MIWLVRRLIAPFVLGGIVSAAIILVTLLPAAGIWRTVSTPGELWYVAFITYAFEAIGLALFVPLAVLASHRLRVRPSLPWILTLIGAGVGAAIQLPFVSLSDWRGLLGLVVPAACGASSALVWFAVNRAPLRRSA